jgi:hypothetical protein
MGLAKYIALYGRREIRKIFAKKPERKRPPGRSSLRWMDNIKMDLRKIDWRGVDWINLAHDKYQWWAVVNTIINIRVLYNVGKSQSSCTTGSFSRRAYLHEVRLLDSINRLGFVVEM